MKTYRLTYTCESFTLRVDVQAEDRARAEMQGRFLVNEKINPKHGAVSLRGFAGALAFNGRYELSSMEEVS